MSLGTKAGTERYIKLMVGCNVILERSESVQGMVVVKCHRKMINKIRKHEFMWKSVTWMVVYMAASHEVLKREKWKIPFVVQVFNDGPATKYNPSQVAEIFKGKNNESFK